ncbi:MAG: hypothetical protein DME65_12095 [Verrucomicrobia bacterium]|nr:MAG: hypothetical protein DME65_12095 [Verrucomicrobiota bacterium]
MCLFSANVAVSWQPGASPREFKSTCERALKARFNGTETEPRFQRLARWQATARRAALGLK